MTAIRIGTMAVVVLITTALLTLAHGDACWVAAVALATCVAAATVALGSTRRG